VLTSLEDRLPADHPLRAMRTMVDAALEEMSPQLAALYARRGRPSIAPAAPSGRVDRSRGQSLGRWQPLGKPTIEA